MRVFPLTPVYSLTYRPAVNFRRVGDSTLEVSEISLGTWLTFGDRDLDASRACVNAALECGINLFDTADVYADGAAERVLGELLRDVPRDAVVIASKCFFPRSEDRADRGLSRRHIVASVERSLRNLRTDRVDLMQCHRFDPDVPLAETVAAMDELVRAGKIRHWGIGRFDAGQTAAAVRVAREMGAVPPIANQYVYSFLNREIEAEVVPACTESGVGILAYSPLGQGVLTGKYAGGEIPARSRAADERFRRGMWEWKPAQIARVESLRSIAAEDGLSLAQLALAWCLRLPAVASAIIGATRPEQVRENARASGVRLALDVLERMEQR
jgi:aryl-alcohol dehydrogenase-like predicted oxidoreductase